MHRAIALILTVSLTQPACVMMLFDDSENIRAVSEPAGAEAYVDGFSYGRTPTVIHLDKKSSHVVTFRKEGYEDSTLTIDRRLNPASIPVFLGGLLLWGIFEFISFFEMESFMDLKPDQLNARLAPKEMPQPAAAPVKPEPTFSKSVAALEAPFRPGYRRRIAAVVGINYYEEWPPLEGAVSDARTVAAKFRSMGFDDVLEIYDEEASQQRILDLFGTDLTERALSDDLVVLYFSGHGHTETLHDGQKRGYIVPADAETNRMYSTAISMQSLRELSNRVPAKHIYFVIDSCYSGLGLTRGISRVGKPAGYIDQASSYRAVQIITAGGEGELAQEFGGKGLFTTKFISALEGEADADADGFLTAREIGIYVRREVFDATAGSQRPQYGSLTGPGEIIFAVP